MIKASIGNMSMCDIPKRVQPIASAFCLSSLGTDCIQLPCALVYQANETDQHETYLSDGRSISIHKPENPMPVKVTQSNASQVQL